jgi:hypothetical protein
MNKILVFGLLLLASCSGKEKKSESTEWKELGSFHKVMADAFHPLKDSGNLAPAKQLASQLADEAEKLASSTLPEKINNEEMKSNLEKLKADSKSLAAVIAKGATDEVVKEKLNSLHDQFHKIMEAASGGHEHHEEHEH